MKKGIRFKGNMGCLMDFLKSKLDEESIRESSLSRFDFNRLESDGKEISIKYDFSNN